MPKRYSNSACTGSAPPHSAPIFSAPASRTVLLHGHGVAALEIHIVLLPLADPDGHIRKHGEQLRQHGLVALRKQTVGPNHHRIARKNRHIVVPARMHGRLAPTHVRTVHDVVVQQREIMENLYGHRGRLRSVDPSAESRAGHQQGDRPDPLAALLERISDRLVQQARLARPFHRPELLLEDPLQFIERVHIPKYLSR